MKTIMTCLTIVLMASLVVAQSIDSVAFESVTEFTKADIATPVQTPNPEPTPQAPVVHNVGGHGGGGRSVTVYSSAACEAQLWEELRQPFIEGDMMKFIEIMNSGRYRCFPIMWNKLRPFFN